MAFKGKQHIEWNIFSSVHIQIEALTITYEHPSSEYQFERKFQGKIALYDQSFVKYEEILIKFKYIYHDKLRKSSSGTIQNEVLTITSEHPYSDDNFERKLQANIFHLLNFWNHQNKNWWISWNNSIKNQNILKKNWLLSTQKYHAS